MLLHHQLWFRGHREVRQLAQGHTAGNWDSEPGSLILKIEHEGELITPHFQENEGTWGEMLPEIRGS